MIRSPARRGPLHDRPQGELPLVAEGLPAEQGQRLHDTAAGVEDLRRLLLPDGGAGVTGAYSSPSSSPANSVSAAESGSAAIRSTGPGFSRAKLTVSDPAAP